MNESYEPKHFSLTLESIHHVTCSDSMGEMLLITQLSMIFNYCSSTNSSNINTTKSSTVSIFENKIISGFDSHPKMQLKCLRFAVSNISYWSLRALFSVMTLCLPSAFLVDSSSIELLHSVVFSQQKLPVFPLLYFIFKEGSRTMFWILFHVLLIYIFASFVF